MGRYEEIWRTYVAMTIALSKAPSERRRLLLEHVNQRSRRGAAARVCPQQLDVEECRQAHALPRALLQLS